MIKIKNFNKNNAAINSYVLIKNDKAICIDPGFNGEEIYHFFIDKNLILEKVILTHGHFDHIRDIELLYKNFQFELYVHKQDMELLKNNAYNYAEAFGQKFSLPKEIKVTLLEDEDEIVFEGEKFKIISTPGHTKGSISIKYQNLAFTGDTLFYDSIGRTDLYSGSMKAINSSLKKLLKVLSNNTIIYPGHGKIGKLKDMKEDNIFLTKLDL